MAFPKSDRKGERAFHGRYPGLAGRHTTERILMDTHGNPNLWCFIVIEYRLMTVGHGDFYGRSLPSSESLRGFEVCMGETGFRLS